MTRRYRRTVTLDGRYQLGPGTTNSIELTMRVVVRVIRGEMHENRTSVR